MKINLWGINYFPEPVGIAVYSTQMSEYLAAQGHQVTVTTAFPYYPAWRLNSGETGLVRTQTINGIKVYRNWIYVPRKVTTRRRIIHELSFVFFSTIRQLLLSAPDVYLVVSPPLLIGVAAWFISVVKRRPYVIHIQDLQPEAAITLGLIKQPWLIKLLLAVESFSYAHATRISVITNHMRSVLIGKGVPAEKIEVIPNSVCTSTEYPAQGKWKKKFGVEPTTPVVSYSGNLGVKQGLESVLDAACELSIDHPVRFVICGDGAIKEKLQETITTMDLRNVLLLNVLSNEDYQALLADSDICLVTLKPGTGASFLPSKLLNILVAGKPIITNADPGSALYQAVSDGGFGVTCADGGPHLAKAISQALEDRTRLDEMAKAGRVYVQQFEEKKVLADLDELMTLLASKSLNQNRV